MDDASSVAEFRRVMAEARFDRTEEGDIFTAPFSVLTSAHLMTGEQSLKAESVKSLVGEDVADMFGRGEGDAKGED